MARTYSFPQLLLTARSSGRTALLLFLALFTPFAVIATGLFYWNLQVRIDQELAALQNHERSQVEATAQILRHDLKGVTADLMILAHASCVKRLLNSGSVADEKGVVDLFVEMSQEKQIYDQIRYIDLAGMEIVRINLDKGRAQIVSKKSLQSKAGRYFFQDSIRLADGEVYVSPLDLNIEHDAIQIPYKPMLRVGTPVFNRLGEKKGVVLVNLYGSTLIDHFRQATNRGRHAMLLNRDGDWLSSPDPSQEWGFMFGNPHAFAKHYPTEWQTLVSKEVGSFTTEAGLFTYDTVYPLQAGQRSATGSPLPVGSSAGELRSQDYFWKVVSLVPTAELPSLTSPRYKIAFVVFGGLMALLAVLSGYLAVLLISRRQLRQKVFDNEKKLRDITATLGEGVYVLDANGVITYVNPEAERLLGWPSQDLLGKNSHALFHHHRADGMQLPESECAISKVIRSGQVYRNDDEVFWRKDGTQLAVRVSSSPIRRDGEALGSVVAFQDITEYKRNQAEIRRLAFYDTLTDLPNRRLFLERLNYALAQAKRHQRALAVMFMDLDHFKEINDTFGHDTGDELLKVVATRLNSSVRNVDTIARQSGDEFVILLSEITQPADAVQVAEKLLSVLREPITARGHALEITGSVGVSIYPANGTDDAQELMKKADSAMYAAKKAGRNRYCIC